MHRKKCLSTPLLFTTVIPLFVSFFSLFLPFLSPFNSFLSSFSISTPSTKPFTLTNPHIANHISIKPPNIRS